MQVLLLTCLGLFGDQTALAYGQVATTVASTPLPTGTVPSGTVVPLVASVSDRAGVILSGDVTFFDGTKPIGTISVVRNGTAGYVPGTAILRRMFGPGRAYHPSDV